MILLTKIPPEALFGLIGVVIGSLLSVIGVLLTNRSNHKNLKIQLEQQQLSETKKIERERFEELYILVSGWLQNMSTNYLSLNMVMQGKLRPDEHMEIVKQNIDLKKYDFNRLKMISSIYAHHLDKEVKELYEIRTELNNIARAYMEVANTALDTDEFLKPYLAAQVKLEKVGERFREKIAEYAKNA